MLKALCRVILALIVVVGAAQQSEAQSISTAAPNSGQGGTWMNLTATNTTLYITSFQVYFQNATVGTAASVQVYRRPGTYVGFTTSSAGWTLHQTIATASAGQTTLVSLNLTTPITVPAGQTVGVYLIGLTSGNGLRYINPGTQPTWTNNDLTLYSEHAKITNVAFSTTNIATPRTFAGVVNYFRDPTAIGACCRPDGSCTSGAPTDCDTAPAGLWQGATTSCGSISCPQPGACCGPENAVCTFTASFACTSPNTFTSAGSTCTPTNPCPAGACCKPDGSCTSVTSARCQSSGGIYTSDGITCGAAGCPQPGACCLPSPTGGCQALVQSDCSVVGGTFSSPGTVCAAGGCWTTPILYDNGGVVTEVGTGSGGANISRMPANGAAIGANFASTTRVASQFVVPAGQVWTITSFKTLGYLTNASSATNPFTALFVRILDRDPRTPGAVVLWGDLTTNRLDLPSSTFANTYRMTAGTASTDIARAVFNLVAPVDGGSGFNVGAGTYWIEWSATTGSTAFIPLVTVSAAMPYGTVYNAGATNVYTRLADGGYLAANWINATPVGFPYALPFVLEGSIGVGGACCEATGLCNVVVGDPAVCASGTLIPGATCAAGPCPPGACCLADGSCSAVANENVCNTSGGTWTSSGTACGSTSCPQPGACCLGNGGCVALLEPECTSASGTFTAATLCAAAGCWTAPILYHNGGITTDPGASPGGEDVSQVPLTSTTAGYSWNFPTGFGVADDFTIPPGQTWTLTKFRTRGYQTGAPPSPLPFTDMRVAIFDRDPRDPLAVMLWGDLTTNRLNTTASTFTNVYRVFNGAITDTTRPVFDLVADVPNVMLGAGTYWVGFSAVNGAVANIPAVTTPNFIPFGNALQFNTTTWGPIRDANFLAPSYASVAGKPVGVPFILEGSTGGGGVCCRGATCNAAVAQAACLGSGTAGAFFSPASNCNAPNNNISPCCHSDYNKIDGITVADIFDFLNSWFAGSPFAAIGTDGTSATLAVQNIFDFLNAWFAGGC